MRLTLFIVPLLDDRLENKIIQCGDASLGDYNGAQVEKDGGQSVVLADMSHACHTDEPRRFPVRCDLSAGNTSRMATVVHDGDVSAGHQLCECKAQSGRTGACDEQRRQGRIGGACGRGHVVDCVILPKAKVMSLGEARRRRVIIKEIGVLDAPSGNTAGQMARSDMIFVLFFFAVIERATVFFFLWPGDKLMFPFPCAHTRTHTSLYQTFPTLTFQSYRDQL